MFPHGYIIVAGDFFTPKPTSKGRKGFLMDKGQSSHIEFIPFIHRLAYTRVYGEKRTCHDHIEAIDYGDAIVAKDNG